MATYKVQIVTGDVPLANTVNSVAITLVGTQGESSQEWLNLGIRKITNKEIKCDRDLGPIVLVHVQKKRLFLEDAWFCNFIQVTGPAGEIYRFPCYQWIEGNTTLHLREGKGKKYSDDTIEFLKEHRRQELQKKQENYQWKEYAPGWPRCLNVGSVAELDSNARFSSFRLTSFTGIQKFEKIRLSLKGFLTQARSWKNLEEIRTIFSRINGREIVPEYVAAHWKEDTFFGYQFLNGINPVMIQKCTQLPAYFPVTEEMVAGALGAGTSLKRELQDGHIFLVDYKDLEDIPTHTIHGRQQYIAAPLCLVHQNQAGELQPIAIQLSQTPGPKSPIFLPSDSEWDWILAKTWVRNSEFYIHQIITHLLKTHLFAEVFSIATIRQLPMCHPLFKLLLPHYRFTLHINTLARSVLINPEGVIIKSSGFSHEGMVLLLSKTLEQVTYDSLCLPDNIQARGVSSIPNYLYRDDGLKIWEAIKSFVSGIVAFYYPSDDAVQGDPELQAWMNEIFVNGFLSRASSGIPSSLRTVAELRRFLTMVIFTCSAQHASVNNGQYDIGAWVPNYSSSMRRPPPEVKGRTSQQDLLDCIPEVDTSATNQAALLLLSSRVKDMRLLGDYREEHFTEQEPKRLIRAFQRDLKEIADDIELRNQMVELPYNYMNPQEMENSVSI
ncbi:hydroperoxide isomerase ALOXE3-like [Alligator mississippiensis]|uniref:hydroperoxide isomerase ALOXE3-like n=1 Tax=Alligator mississippiensis TaxID=8496 RepID=UPI0028777C83|nr:hydroperoxide isomerase ALOXE3-like [Alligator mississippiensis]